MAKHESKQAAQAAQISIAILRSWRDIDPKVLRGFASSITVGAIITAGQTLGVTIPMWLALVIVALVYGVVAYWTKSRIPLPDDSGLTENQAAIVNGAGAVGVELGTREASFGDVGELTSVEDDQAATSATPPATNSLDA